MPRIKSIDISEGPPGSDPAVVRLIAKLEPPASRDELGDFKKKLHVARLVGGAQDGVGFDVQVDAARDKVDETMRELRGLIDGSIPSG